VGSFLTAQQHILGYSVPEDGAEHVTNLRSVDDYSLTTWSEIMCRQLDRWYEVCCLQQDSRCLAIIQGRT